MGLFGKKKDIEETNTQVSEPTLGGLNSSTPSLEPAPIDIPLEPSDDLSAFLDLDFLGVNNNTTPEPEIHDEKSTMSMIDQMSSLIEEEEKAEPAPVVAPAPTPVAQPAPNPVVKPTPAPVEKEVVEEDDELDEDDFAEEEDDGETVDEEGEYTYDDDDDEEEIIIDPSKPSAVPVVEDEPEEIEEIADEVEEISDEVEELEEPEEIIEEAEEVEEIVDEVEDLEEVEEAEEIEEIIEDVSEPIEEAIEEIPEEVTPAAEEIVEDVPAAEETEEIIEDALDEDEEIVEVTKKEEPATVPAPAEEVKEEAKPSKFLKVAALIDFMIAQNMSKNIKMKMAMLLLTVYPKFKNNPEDKKAILLCMKKIVMELAKTIK